MFKAYKYRIYPTEPQRELIEKIFGCCRLVYNLALETKIRAYKDARVSLSAFDLQRQLTEMKKEYQWMKEVDSMSLQKSIANMDNAFKKFFSGSGYPKFKKKSGHQSFQSREHCRIYFDIATIKIPKLTPIRLKIDRIFDGEIKNVTISRTPTLKYYASVLVENKKELPKKPIVSEEKTIGIDVGIKSMAITSDGKTFEPNRYLKNSLRRLQCLQRRASRKNKCSKNRKKSNLCVAKLHEKITNQRTDYIHKITSELICDNQAETFVIEDLNVVGMMKNRKLSKSISDVSFGEFFRQIKYKCDWHGKNLIKIGRFEPSSKTCSGCGNINETLTLKDREWVCANCGATHDRDINAAKNIKEFGLKKTFRDGQSR